MSGQFGQVLGEPAGFSQTCMVQQSHRAVNINPIILSSIGQSNNDSRVNTVEIIVLTGTACTNKQTRKLCLTVTVITISQRTNNL